MVRKSPSLQTKPSPCEYDSRALRRRQRSRDRFISYTSSQLSNE